MNESELKKLVMVLFIFVVVFGGGVYFYYNFSYLPALEKQKIDERNKTYNICMQEVNAGYLQNWASACKSVANATAEMLRNCLSDPSVVDNPYMGQQYCRNNYGNVNFSPDCELPKGRAESIEENKKEGGELCLNKAKIGLQ